MAGVGSTKVDETFYQTTGVRLEDTSLLRLFNVLLDEDRITKYLNIFKTLRINIDRADKFDYFETYSAENDAWWDNIANAIYGSPKLWWVVAVFNDVVNPFEELDEGQLLKILKPDYLFDMFKDMDVIREL